MRSNLIFTLLAASLSLAAPVAKKVKEESVNLNSTVTDSDILNFALTLEHLESAFYEQGLKKYSIIDFEKAGYPNWIRERFTEIASQESTHVAFLRTALTSVNATAVEPCNYNFPDTSPASFLALSQVLEGVGTSAYLGAMVKISDKILLGAAGGILTVEGRHDAWIRSAGNNGDAFPEAFDTPLDFNQAYSLASQFISSCPETNPTLPFKAFPILSISAASPLVAGSALKLTFAGSNKTESAFAIFLVGLNQIVVPYNSTTGIVSIPLNASVAGQNYVLISSKNATMSDDTILAGPVAFDVPVPNRNFSLDS